MRKFITIFTLFTALLITEQVLSQDKVIAWSSLTPVEQQTLAPLQNNWQKLSPERQAKLRNNAQRWSQMDPQQQAKIKQNRKRWQSLTPEQREQLKVKRAKFLEAPALSRHDTGTTQANAPTLA